MPEFRRLPGFRDFPPEELAVRSHIFDAWRRVSRRYGFEEYDGPPLEPLDLYREKSGEEIVAQLYAFRDRGGREVALRPEMTPSLARILAVRARAMPKPIRWFSIPQLFRYERAQRGRLREHFQWNVDIVGEAGVGADAEVLAVGLDGLRELGLGAGDIRARVSDRRLLGALLREVGVPEGRVPAAFGAVDKLEREGRARVRSRLAEDLELGEGTADRVLGLFEEPELEAVRRRFGGVGPIRERVDALERYFGLLDEMGLGDFIVFDLTIVRGLAYYTGIVFEIFDRRGELRAICGGGRYDRLLELVGGDPLPAVGFGMGDVVLAELLRSRDLLPRYEGGVDVYVAAVGPGERGRALRIARRQRELGRRVVYSLGEQSLRKQFSNADAVGAREVIVLGPREASEGVAVVRDMRTGEERRVPLRELEG